MGQKQASEPDLSYQKVQFITIDDDHAERRIDNFLFNYLKSIPKGRVYKMLRKGEVRVNKKRIKTNYRLLVGDEVRIPPIFIEEQAELRVPHRVIDLLLSSKLYEDESFLILNKPSGIPVHAGSGLSFGVIEALRSTPEYKDRYIELAHRLDRETSGCLILVKQPQVLRKMNKLIKDNAMSKEYIALVKGQWKGGSKKVDVPLSKNTMRGGERVVQVNKSGKSALTEFVLKKKFEATSLLKVILHTGRTHQIRVHSAYMGMPIACDTKYGHEGFNKMMRKKSLKRLFLHASFISFKLEDMERITIKAPLSPELDNVLNDLS